MNSVSFIMLNYLFSLVNLFIIILINLTDFSTSHLIRVKYRLPSLVLMTITLIMIYIINLFVYYLNIFNTTKIKMDLLIMLLFLF